MNRGTKVLLIGILLLASVLRLWDLGKVPEGFNSDEAAIGYNAYSILKTGKDEYGKFLPLSFKSFGEYKLPVYIYLTVPSVAVFGLNEFATRVPSAVFGILTVFVTYILVKKLFKNEFLALLTVLFLSVSPWHLQFSRTAFEANIAVFLVISGVTLFIMAVNEKKSLLPFSLILFVLSLYTYNSARFIAPLLLLILTTVYFKQVFSNKKIVFVSILAAVILVLPLIPMVFTDVGLSRFEGVNLTADPGPLLTTIERRNDDKNSPYPSVVHNKYTAYGKALLTNYLSHYSFDYLFFNGDPIDRLRTVDTGILLRFELPFFVLGFLVLVSLWQKKEGKLILLWILIAPLPAAITLQSPHSLRSILGIPAYQMVSALGFAAVYNFLGKINRFAKAIFLGFSLILLTFNVFFYLHYYYVHNFKDLPNAWQYGYRDMVGEVSKIESKYDQVVVTEKYGQPYIFFLFYEKVDPSWYQKEARLEGRDRFGFGAVRKIGKYSFRGLNWDSDCSSSKTLCVGGDREVPDGVKVINTIYLGNNIPAFIIAEGGKLH